MLFLSILALLFSPALAAREPVAVPSSSSFVKDDSTGVEVPVRVPAFVVSPTEVTQREFQEVMGYNPSIYQGTERPVENVSWFDAIRYCNLRSIKEGLDPCYDLASGRCDRSKNGYRLPSEVEWEAAAGLRPGASFPKEAAPQLASASHLGPVNTRSEEALLRRVREVGTADVAGRPANSLGLHDVLGNVWEWCDDYFNPVRAYAPASAPAGPASGNARVIRGGSFVTPATGWTKGFRSSMNASAKSRFTGFRVVRSAPARAPEPAADPDRAWLETYNRIPRALAGQTGGLRSPLETGSGRIDSRERWSERARSIEQRWMKILGAPRIAAPKPAARLVETVRDAQFTGRLMELQVEPDYWEKIFVIEPPGQGPRPAPVVIVPYYDIDTPAGRNLGGRNYLPPSVRSFAYLAAQQGFYAVAVRWFGESYGEAYSEAVANVLMRHPDSTGMGKWVWDARRLIDYLETVPGIDKDRIGIIGHSLGGKMALYAAAMDQRIRAVVSSEPGIGLSYSNYQDFWYLGSRMPKGEGAADHHELLALIAPRAFLLIGGDSADNDKSWHYINSAREVYGLLGGADRIGYINHRSGHTPTAESVRDAMEWLAMWLRQ